MFLASYLQLNCSTSSLASFEILKIIASETSSEVVLIGKSESSRKLWIFPFIQNCPNSRISHTISVLSYEMEVCEGHLEPCGSPGHSPLFPELRPGRFQGVSI